jgi:hypothetical protein
MDAPAEGGTSCGVHAHRPASTSESRIDNSTGRPPPQDVVFAASLPSSRSLAAQLSTARVAAARRDAEANCTMHEIAAHTGHASLHEVERYTKAADQAKLARAAMARTMAAVKGVA